METGRMLCIILQYGLVSREGFPILLFPNILCGQLHKNFTWRGPSGIPLSVAVMSHRRLIYIVEFLGLTPPESRKGFYKYMLRHYMTIQGDSFSDNFCLHFITSYPIFIPLINLILHPHLDLDGPESYRDRPFFLFCFLSF